MSAEIFRVESEGNVDSFPVLWGVQRLVEIQEA